jgi:hypothetical protein
LHPEDGHPFKLLFAAAADGRAAFRLFGKRGKKRQNSQNYSRAKSDVFEGISPTKAPQAAAKSSAP